jgi:hypothetical protein
MSINCTRTVKDFLPKQSLLPPLVEQYSKSVGKDRQEQPLAPEETDPARVQTVAMTLSFHDDGSIHCRQVDLLAEL